MLTRRSVARVTAEHGTQCTLALDAPAEPQQGEPREKMRRRDLARLRVIVEEQHRRQGRGKVVDLGGLSWKLPRVSQQLAQQLSRSRTATEFFPRERGEISFFRK